MSKAFSYEKAFLFNVLRVYGVPSLKIDVTKRDVKFLEVDVNNFQEV